MKVIKLFVLMFLMSFAMFSEEIKREEKISGIKEVSVNGSLVLNINKNASETLTFEGKENIIKDIKVKVRGNFLEIEMPKKTYWAINDKVIVNLNLKDFKELEFNGAGDILIKGFSFKDFKLKMDGSSNAILKENKFENLKIELNGSGTVEVNGKSRNLTATLDGVGKLSAFDLETDAAKINLNGTGKVEINVKDFFSATLNGVGKIVYKGKPKLEKIELNGLGTIKNYQE